MNLERVRPVVDAVLYEGYILYPYRATSTKNRSRWTFGGIYPKAYFDATGGMDPCHMQTQCLVEGGGETRMEVRVRFLQPVAREVGKLAEPLDGWQQGDEPEFTLVPSMTLGGKQYHAWQEAMERDVAVADCKLVELLRQSRHLSFEFTARRDIEPIRDDDDRIRGVLAHSQTHVKGRVALGVETVAEDIFRLTVRIENHTEMDSARVADREQASLYSFASTHTILGVENGGFVSLMDPPQALCEAVAACDNQGAYPVLVGEPGSCSTMLASPIILYDHPEVAPESPGDMYDATEIDEILSLNILAMTDDEKSEMAATDPRAAALLARTEALNGEDFMRLHGTLRDAKLTDESAPSPQASPRRRRGGEPEDFPPPHRGGSQGEGESSPFAYWQSAGRDFEVNPLEPEPGGPCLAYCDTGGMQLKVGDRVRLHPRAGGDVMDIVLDGKVAVIESIERDFENRVHVAVALDDDPGREWGLQRMPGHRFFFSVEEIETLEQASRREMQT